jgi:TetR/AcrR family transcriptional regulator, regulator of cefoperazone and chloramphenicol sensitivity
MYIQLYMRSGATAQEDLTAKARIRDTALELFAARGVAATSLRAVAKAAGVSPALVVHHFGSKDGLCQAVDRAVVRRFTLALREVPIEGAGEELLARRAELITALVRSEPVVCEYIARTLPEGSAASADLFRRMFAAGSSDDALIEAGALRPGTDAFWRAVQQIVLLVGPLMLRPLVERELGESLYAGDNVERWMKANVELLQHGIYAGGR